MTVVALAPNFFIGRADEFLRVGGLLSDIKDVSRLLAISGKGGYGKTRLLQEFYRDQERLATISGRPVVCLSPLDFDDIGLHSLLGILYSIAKSSAGNFSNYIDKHNAYIRLERQVSDEHDILENLRACENAFIEDFNKFSHDKCVVIPLDTVEQLQNTDLLLRLIHLLKQLQNALIVMAGRNLNKQPVWRTIQGGFGKSGASLHLLQPFNPAEVKDYFEHSGVILDDVMRRKLYLLTNGHPILIALAEYWLIHDMPVDDVTDIPLERLEKLSRVALKKRQQDFEAILINNILELKTIDQAILRMAFFNRFFNDEILKIVLKPEEHLLDDVIRQLHELPFVKPRPNNSYALHDEMCRLVMKHTWPMIDPHETQRRLLAKRIVNEYYIPKLNVLKEELDYSAIADGSAHQDVQSELISNIEKRSERARLEADITYYLLLVDLTKGYEFFDQTFEKAMGSNHLQRVDLLLDTMESHRDRLTANLQLDLRIKRARRQIISDRLVDKKKAETFLKKLLEQELNDDNKLEVLSTLAGRTRDLEYAIELRKQCVELANKHPENLVQLVHAYRYLGLAYRRAGYWNHALKNYQLALPLAEKLQNSNLRGSIVTHIGYIYRLKGYTDKADIWCGRGLMFRKKNPNERDLAFSYQTYGEVYSDQRLTAKALEQFELGAAIFRELCDNHSLARSLVHIANIYRQRHEPELVEHYLRETIEICKKGHYHDVLASAYNEYGCEYRKRGRELWRKTGDRDESLKKFRLAQNYLDDALKLAREIGDSYRLTDILIDLALLQLYRYEIVQKPQYKTLANTMLDEIDSVLKKHFYALFAGRAAELRGDFCRVDDDLETAFATHYVEACTFLAPYPSERFHESIERILKRMHGLPEQITDYEKLNAVLFSMRSKLLEKIEEFRTIYQNEEEEYVLQGRHRLQILADECLEMTKQ